MEAKPSKHDKLLCDLYEAFIFVCVYGPTGKTYIYTIRMF